MVEGNPGVYRDSDFVVQNGWIGYIGSQFWQVFAGARGDEQRQGVLTVMWRDEYGKLVGGTVMDTPNRFGWIRITAVDIPIVHLVAEDGSTLAFDLDKLAWVP